MGQIKKNIMLIIPYFNTVPFFFLIWPIGKEIKTISFWDFPTIALHALHCMVSEFDQERFNLAVDFDKKIRWNFEQIRFLNFFTNFFTPELTGLFSTNMKSIEK